MFVNAAFENQGKLSQFNLDLALALTSADIPFFKLENPELRTFLEKYCTKQSIPHESTLRKRYLSICYNQTMKNIADEVKGKKIWVSVDETTDVMGRMIGNVVIGILSAEEAGKTYLLNSVHLEHTNHATMCTLFLDYIKLLGDSFDAKTQFALSNGWSRLHASFWEDHQRYLSKYYPCNMFGTRVAPSLRNSQIIVF